jgi:RNA polymerase sigma-70 factor (ECF subfamily)
MLTENFLETLARARAGDEGAFTLLYRDVQPALLRYARARAPHRGEDICEDVWVEVVRGLHRFAGDEQGFRAWIFTIARHKIIDGHRYEGRRRTVPLDGTDEMNFPTVRDVAEDQQDGEATRAALTLVRTLPAQQAEVILLRVVAGLDCAQTARIVGKSPGAVRVLSHRGLRRLAAALATESERGGVGR